jgi:hypothetical protein
MDEVQFAVYVVAVKLPVMFLQPGPACADRLEARPTRLPPTTTDTASRIDLVFDVMSDSPSPEGRGC